VRLEEESLAKNEEVPRTQKTRKSRTRASTVTVAKIPTGDRSRTPMGPVSSNHIGCPPPCRGETRKDMPARATPGAAPPPTTTNQSTSRPVSNTGVQLFLRVSERSASGSACGRRARTIALRAIATSLTAPGSFNNPRPTVLTRNR